MYPLHNFGQDSLDEYSNNTHICRLSRFCILGLIHCTEKAHRQIRIKGQGPMVRTRNGRRRGTFLIHPSHRCECPGRWLDPHLSLLFATFWSYFCHGLTMRMGGWVGFPQIESGPRRYPHRATSSSSQNPIELRVPQSTIR